MSLLATDELDLDSNIRDEPQNVAARMQQEQLWAETEVNGRKQLAAREGALRFRSRFCDAMNWYETIELIVSLAATDSSFFAFLEISIIEIVVSFLYPRQDGLCRPLSKLVDRSAQEVDMFSTKNGVGQLDSPFKIFVRPRPTLSFENNANEYSVVRSTSDHHIALHDGRLDRTGRRLNMRHFQYGFDRVFHPEHNNEEVCEQVMRPLLRHAMAQRRDGTLILYGQTGTGKTYTLRGCMNWLGDTMEKLREENIDISFTFFEIHGKKCYDLLENRNLIRLLSDSSGTVHPRGIKAVKLQRPTKKELDDVLLPALSLRSIEATERNPISSRSHAVLKIRMFFHDTNLDGDENADKGMGSIRLVDLAGSERNYETIKMTPQMHRESADINKSLFSLKDCFRAYNTLARGLKCTPYQIKIPLSSRLNVKEKERQTILDISNKPMASAPARLHYRAHMLTRVLRECFCENTHKTFVLACISPTSTDIEHSLNTLNHVALMNKDLDDLKFVASVSVPMSDGSSKASWQNKSVMEWTAEEVHAWITTVDNGAFSHVVLPAGFDGQKLLAIGKMRLSELFTQYRREARREGEGYAWAERAENVDDEALSQRLFEMIRDAAVDAFVFRE
jgi:hypothetical protein